MIVFTAGPGPRDRAVASLSDGCNGSPELCSHRLNEVVFAGTHNSFSAADDPGWFIANQLHNIPQQLEDGIRLFLIDPHWGIEGSDGRVQTDFEAEGRDRNKVVKALPPDTLAAAERLAGRVGIRSEGDGEKDVFLCHTVCELGATKMVDALDDIREFLDRNPGEVVIIFIEPYVSPEDIEDVFQRGGPRGHGGGARSQPAAAHPRRARADRQAGGRDHRARRRRRPALVHGRVLVRAGHPPRGDQARGPELQARARATATARC